MKISLIIPAYNEEAYIGSCLDSVIQHAEGELYEIIVIDNASNDHTSEIAGKIPGVKVVQEEKKGLTYARQRGLEEAKGDIIAYIDADTKLPSGWIHTVKQVFSNQPEVVCLSGPCKYWDGPTFRNWIINNLWWISAPLTYRLVGYMVFGSNFVAKKEALIAMGGFNTNIEFYGEDTDIARRIHKYGKVLFRMDFFIYSSSRRFTSEGIFKTSMTYALNFIWPILFHRPFTLEHNDIRLENQDKNS